MAVDNDGAVGQASATHVNVDPTIGAMSAAPSIQQGDTLALFATGVTAGDHATTSTIRKVEFFLDANYDGVFQPGVDTFLGRGVQTGPSTWELYNWVTDPVTAISYATLPTVTWESGTRTYFAFAQDASDNWSAAAIITQDVINLSPLIGNLSTNPEPAVQGQDITFTATGVEDRFGQVNSVAFYLDTIDANHLLGVDESPLGGWSLTTTVADLGPSVSWGGGAHTYWAVVTDNSGDPTTNTTSISVVGNVNQAPTVGDLTPNPEPVTQSTQLVLTLEDAQDPDGDDIVDVQFYRDSNGNGSFDVGVDQLLSNYVGGNVQYLSGNPDGSGTYTWTGPANFPEGQQIYFARAKDSNGAWSDVSIGSGRVQNAVPTISDLALNPDPVTQGYNLTLTAQNVTDLNGTITKVEFYLDSNNNGSLNPASDLLLGTISFSNTSDYALTVPVSWAAGAQLYFARAQDNEGAWSDTALASGSVNARPTITQLTANPSPYVPNDPVNLLTLTATGVSDADGTIASVSFYRDTNGDGVYEAGQDALIGTDTSVSGGWSLSFTDTTAVRRFFAIATDNSGGNSQAAQVDVQRRPTIGSLSATPNPVTAQQQLVLLAGNVKDIDGTIDSVQFYRDDGDGIYNPATDYLLGTDTTAGDGWKLNVSPDWGGGNATFYARARDNEGNYSLTTVPYVPLATAYVDYSPVINGGLTLSADPVNRGDNLTLTAVNVTDFDGTVDEVDFYRDANGNGVLDPTVDDFLGTGTESSGDWSLTVSTAGYPLGLQTYMALAIDNKGAQSDVASATGTINGLPQVGSLQLNPDPVVRGEYLTLTALGVVDADGTVSSVRFYKDANANGVWDAGDTLLDTDVNGGDGWSVTVSTAGYTVGANSYFAKAVDNLGAVGPAAKAVGTVTTSPSLVIALQPGSDTGVSQVDGITMDTTPTFDFVVNDPGLIQIDWDNNGTFDASIVSIGAGTYSLTSPVLTEGMHTIAGRFTDDASNVTNTTRDITIDTTAPAKPDAPDLQDLSDNGTLNYDNITSILTPTFTITGGDAYLRFFRDGTQISGDFEPDSVYTTPTQSLGTYAFSVEAVDAAGNASAMSDTLTVMFTTRPATPAAPDLQAGSDSGVSQTDNITNDTAPVFNTVPGIASPYTVRLWRGDTLVNSVDDATQISDPTSPVDGTYDYAITVLDRGTGFESLRSAALAVTIDTTAPTVTDPNISVTLTTDNGVKGLAEFGDTVTIVWDNSASGDNNLDVSSVAVDLSQYGVTTGLSTMYDDGTHGDATAGDGVWTLAYTITSTQINMQSLNVDVYATDIAGNVGVGHDTSGIRVKPKLILQTAYGAFDVSIYDVDGNSDFNPEDIVVKVGKNNSVSSIIIGGTGPAEGLGISISGASSVGSIKDARKGALGQIAFIASDSPIKSIQLKSGMEGYNLNDQVFGNLHFAADVDGDGSTTDATAIWVDSYVGKLSIGGDVTADVWLGGADPKKGMSFGSAQIGGDFHGDFYAWGNGGKLSFGGNFGSLLYVDGALAGLTVGGNMTAGAHVFVDQLLAKFGVGGSLLGNAPEDELVQVLAGSIGKGAIGGNVQHARVLAGADLGADFAVGGAGSDADSFGAGQIGGLKIGGNVSDSLIGAGLVPHSGAFDLAYLAASNAFLDGSGIGKMSINGTLTSSAPGPEQPFGIGAYQVGKYKINGSTTNPLVYSEV